mmetsp:Transcript_41851/g.64030  ORF Transcript_41851/g.64030 Transcript_41851/m.64030 type:complete len:232 (+) Transcript_41851:441-1136(+)|eukprot:CAMPEP_0170484898 /NCGR_PEP_ID=MMETSP0208-20121228/4266_1 /TAXON_ID=197538 /ORGANISM="Strombidium inclinatum, Strain S3" /LENGTH=231 /DNA_ID=CAMNT_0010758363 /DNA_START=420 /DNA_END=1115 /DNA_ORIENTATION=-
MDVFFFEWTEDLEVGQDANYPEYPDLLSSSPAVVDSISKSSFPDLIQDLDSSNPGIYLRKLNGELYFQYANSRFNGAKDFNDTRDSLAELKQKAEDPSLSFDQVMGFTEYHSISDFVETRLPPPTHPAFPPIDQLTWDKGLGKMTAGIMNPKVIQKVFGTLPTEYDHDRIGSSRFSYSYFYPISPAELKVKIDYDYKPDPEDCSAKHIVVTFAPKQDKPDPQDQGMEIEIR